MLARDVFILLISFSCFFSLCLSNSDITTLLSFKASLSDSSHSLSNWVNSSDACFDSWLGVTCNLKTRRVVKLVLENLNLTGSAQVLSKLTQLRLLSLKNNRLSSSNLDLSSWPYIKHLYLSHNRFNGAFSAGISNLRRLRRLDLSYNFFTGEIPIAELTSLSYLLTLRLEANSFTGTLDSVNSSSVSIMDFNVSSNKLSGEIPTWMSRFLVSSFAGNKNLCGRPLPWDCSNQTVVPEPGGSTKRNWKRLLVLVIVIFDSVALAAVLATVTWCCYNRRRSRHSGGSGGVHHEVGVKRGTHKDHCRVAGGGGGVKEDGNAMVVFDLEGFNGNAGKGFRNVEDLLKSSAELLGKGFAGSTYKVVMDDHGDGHGHSGGTDADAVVVVVKRIRDRRKSREVDEWLSVIGELRHSNVVSLRAYYNGLDELLLVYDFLPNGSLHSLLHGNRGPWRIPLDWITRLKLASDSARGLAFLHGYNKLKLCHGHLSSSNIVVDQRGNACISDTGVHQLLRPSLFVNSDYKPPELKLNNGNYSQRKFTQKCDVYGFGVVLLEILTGKMATGDGESSLVEWVQRTGPDERPWEVFDFELVRDKEMEEGMRALLQVALLCLAPLPKDRPKMSTVHRMIEDIRTKGGSIDGGTNSIMNSISSDSSPSQSENAHSFSSS